MAGDVVSRSRDEVAVNGSYEAWLPCCKKVVLDCAILCDGSLRVGQRCLWLGCLPLIQYYVTWAALDRVDTPSGAAETAQSAAAAATAAAAVFAGEVSVCTVWGNLWGHRKAVDRTLTFEASGGELWLALGDGSDPILFTRPRPTEPNTAQPQPQP